MNSLLAALTAAFWRTVQEILDSKQAMALLTAGAVYAIVRLANKFGVPLDEATAKEIGDRVVGLAGLYALGQVAIHLKHGPGGSSLPVAQDPGDATLPPSADPPAPGAIVGKAPAKILAAVAVVLALGGVLAGCSSPARDPAKDALLEEEIATITSMALIPGDRSPQEAAAISARGALVRSHVHDRLGGK